jgi:hypothetical protein
VGSPEEMRLSDREFLSPDWSHSVVAKEGVLVIWRRSPHEMFWSVSMRHEVEEVVFYS